MKMNQDAYGQEIWNYFTEKEGYEIVERNDGYIDISSGPESYFSEFNAWPEHQKRAMDFVKGNVLDIGCGAGRHSLYLQKQGFNITGIDQSPLAIKVCKQRGIKNLLNISISEIRNFNSNSFDTILMLGNNFGLFGSFKRAKILLKTMNRITNPKAYIIAESIDPHQTIISEHLEYQKLNLNRGRMAGQLRIRIRFRKYVGKWFDYLLVSKNEMKEILKDSGWKVKKFIDSENSVYIAILEKCI
jgi:cyclopropane fatty-acyl-phospholipid synthase-like methyltransferase